MHIRNFRRAAISAIVGLLLVGGLATAASASTGVRASAKTRPTHRLSSKQRAAVRRQLLRRLRTNPAYVFSKQFVRKADLIDFQLPMSVRLSKSDGQGGYAPSDDQLEIDWDDSAFSWPLTDGTLSAPQTVFLHGGFTMDGIFGGDTTGYGELGATETVVGRQVTMTADPFTISDFATSCPSGPELATDPAHPVAITTAGPRDGVMNLFSQEVRGTISLRMTPASSIAASCGATPALSTQVDNSLAPPMPVRFNGQFTISPAITPDGKMRFGKITIDDSVTPQLTTFAFVRACTQPTADPTTCGPQQFPARLKFKRLTAEVLLGDVFPS